VDGTGRVTEGNILLVRQYEGYLTVQAFSFSEELGSDWAEVSKNGPWVM
jgi:hypothetical protein